MAAQRGMRAAVVACILVAVRLRTCFVVADSAQLRNLLMPSKLQLRKIVAPFSGVNF